VIRADLLIEGASEVVTCAANPVGAGGARSGSAQRGGAPSPGSRVIAAGGLRAVSAVEATMDLTVTK